MRKTLFDLFIICLLCLSTQAQSTNEIRINFHNAPLESVLSYLSDAAGFIIVPKTQISGHITMFSGQSVTKDELINLLNVALDQNGLAIVREDRTLTLYNKFDVRVHNIPIKIGSKPEDVPKNKETVTQIIPMKYLNVTQLLKDLQELKPDGATWFANEGSNSLIIIDTQDNIHHIMEIISILDTSVANVQMIQVFKLKYADSKAIVAVIKDLFNETTTNSSASNNRVQNRMQMFGRGGPPEMDMPQEQFQANQTTSKNPTATVSAVAEEYSNSVIVKTSENKMTIVKTIIEQLDVDVIGITEISLFKLKNADAQETSDLISNLFSDTNNNSQNSQNSKMSKKTKVSAVADLRTSSVVIIASKDLMAQISDVIKDLDSDPAKKQSVFIYSLQNTDVSQSVNILQSLFPSSSSSATSNTGNRNQTGIENQLNNRATQNQNQTGRRMIGGFGNVGSGSSRLGQ